mgnify:CR=1 FL=1
MKIRYVAFLLVMTCFLPSVAQNETRWEEYYQRWLENNEQMEETNADAYETLSDLQAHPLNLNTATREDLERLPFLSAQQVEGICEYLYHYAPVRIYRLRYTPIVAMFRLHRAQQATAIPHPPKYH